MKQKLLIILTGIALCFVSVVNAQTATPKITPAASPSATIKDKDVATIEEKIATKVAELRMKNNKAVGGTVTDIAGDTITIHTEDDQTYQVKNDEALTKVFQVSTGVKKEMKFSDLKKDNYIIATGVITDKTISANFIYQDDLYFVASGKISEVNKDNFYIKVITTDKDTYTLDIESITRMTMMDIKTLELDKVGFSKFKEGDTVHFVIKKTIKPQEPNRYSAQKILLIPQEYFIGK